ncbi:RDM1 protein, partial [Eolophus roseicapillus]|nr:RDM1 protein [Eolophus roseicapilla]
MAELVEFRVPAGSAQTLLVWGLEPEPRLEVSRGLGAGTGAPPKAGERGRGPPSAASIKALSVLMASPGFFFPGQVCVCTKQKGLQQKVLALSSNKCQELANHYLGFNGWSSRIITLQNVSGFGGENEELGRTLSVKYLCAVEVTLPKHGVCTRGAALAEADVENSADPLELLTATRRVQKLAAGRALSGAFQKILLIVLENGKVAVEYNSSQEEPIDCLTEEELKGLVQV